MKLNIDFILECLDKEEYEKAINYLDNLKIHNETRVVNQLVRMISTMKRISKYEKYDYPKTDYINSKDRFIARFFEALKYKDYFEASILVDDCIQFNETHGRDSEELNIYKQVLEYANNVQQRVLERSNNITKMSNLTYEIEVFSKNNKSISMPRIKWLEVKINEIIDYAYAVGRPYRKLQYALEIIDTIYSLSDNTYKDKSYFGKVSDYSNVDGIINKLYTELVSGDYVNAYQSVRKIVYQYKNVDWMYKLYYILLKYLNGKLTAYNKKEYVDNNYIVYNQIIDYDKMLKKVVKDKNNNDVELMANLVLVKTLKK